MIEQGTEAVMGIFKAFGAKGNHKKVRLTKLEHGKNPTRRSPPVEVGFILEGGMPRPLAVGESFYVLDARELSSGVEYDRWYSSVVQEVFPDNRFRTQNSIYQLKYL